VKRPVVGIASSRPGSEKVVSSNVKETDFFDDDHAHKRTSSL
jgi:hypothetical protein